MSVSTKKITILVVDDHTLIRETCSHMLKLQPNFDVIDSTGDGDRAAEICRQRRPDIVLVDINMPLINGFEVINLVRNNAPLSKIIASSLQAQPATVKKAMKQGAKGFFTKNSPVREMIEAINEVAKGNTYLSNDVKDMLSDQALNQPSEHVDINVLSEREIQILKLLRNGMASREIGVELSISTRTVEVHRHHILKKLKMKNTLAAISYFNSVNF